MSISTRARTHADALRSVSHALRDNIRLRLADKDSCAKEKNKYVRCWESCAATCDDAANYLDEIDQREKEKNNE